MRKVQADQMPLTAGYGGHEHSKELEKISEIFDANPIIYELAHRDLTFGKSATVGRNGLTGEQTVRCGLIKQMHGLSYEDLSFFLAEVRSFETFARIPFGMVLKPKRLQANIKRLSPDTWEAINRILLNYAADHRIETGRKIRADCTSVESNIHAPTDSSLLWDCVRVVTRVLTQLKDTFPDVPWKLSDHTRRAKKRAYEITFPSRKKKKSTKEYRAWAYRDLLRVAALTYGYGTRALEQLDKVPAMTAVQIAKLMVLKDELRDFLDSMNRVMDQTRRRVIHGEKVPANEKLVSIFETHADIIAKGNRDPVYGHKICLTGGASSMILDCVIEEGNPADSGMVKRIIERQIDIYGRPPRQAAFDGGFASKENLRIAKDDLGVGQVAFHKKCGLEISDMVKSAWVFKRLRNFRAGIEGCISTLKRAFQLDRVTWRGFRGFKSYVWASVVSFNAIVLARLLLARS